MPTAYVSTVGDDPTGTIDDPLLPYETWLGAISDSANDGDVQGADGIYDEAFTIVSKTGLTLNAENDFGVTFISSADATRVVRVDDTATGLTIGKLVLDGEGNTSYCVQCDPNTAVDALTLNGTKMIDATTNFVNCGSAVKAKSLTMLGGWSCTGTVSGNIITSSPTVNDSSFDISDGTIIATVSAANRAGVYFYPASLVTGCTLKVNNVSITLTEQGTLASMFGVNSGGADTIDVYDNTITFSDTSSRIAINCAADPDATSRCHVYDNTVLGDPANVTTLGTGIRIGAENSTDRDNISGVKVYGNSISNFDHGLLLGYITSGKAYKNTIDLVDSALVLKGTTTSEAFGNLLTRSGTTYLQTKQGTTDIFANNTVIMSVGYTGIAIYETLDTTHSDGVIFYNNNVYTDTAITNSDFVNVENFATNEIEFYNNNFHSTVALPATAWAYRTGAGAVTAATVTAFNALDAVISGNTDDDPLFTNATSDYTLTVASTLNATGVRWWTGAPPDGLGEPYPSYDIDIGAYQGSDTTNHPFHPVNL